MTFKEFVESKKKRIASEAFNQFGKDTKDVWVAYNYASDMAVYESYPHLMVLWISNIDLTWYPHPENNGRGMFLNDPEKTGKEGKIFVAVFDRETDISDISDLEHLKVHLNLDEKNVE